MREHAAAASIQAHARRRAAMKATVVRRDAADEARRVRRMQAAVREQGGIPLLVALLRDGTPQARANAAGALEQLAHANNDNQVRNARRMNAAGLLSLPRVPHKLRLAVSFCSLFTFLDCHS